MCTLAPQSLLDQSPILSRDRAELLHVFGPNAKPKPLAPWARYFVRLGERIAQAPAATNTRVTLGFALPVLDFAATFFATGLVLERARTKVTAAENMERFAKLKELKPGSGLRLLRNGRLLMGEVSNDAEFDTPTTIPVVVEVSANKRSTFVCNPRNCGSVEPTEILEQIPSRQRGLKIVESPKFAQSLLCDTPVENLCLGSRIDYVIVGVRSKVLAEAETEMACVSDRGGYETGILSDILRIKDGPRDYRGTIISSTTKDPVLPKSAPHVVIFDGATAFSRFQHRFARSHAIVLLDRSEPHFNEAANELNSKFATRAADIPEHFWAGAPTGVEKIGFTSTAHD